MQGDAQQLLARRPRFRQQCLDLTAPQPVISISEDGDGTVVYEDRPLFDPPECDCTEDDWRAIDDFLRANGLGD